MDPETINQILTNASVSAPNTAVVAVLSMATLSAIAFIVRSFLKHQTDSAARNADTIRQVVDECHKNNQTISAQTAVMMGEQKDATREQTAAIKRLEETTSKTGTAITILNERLAGGSKL